MNNCYKKECECISEYILPDYLGDVRKILSVRAVTRPVGEFLGEGELHLNGSVLFDVIYSDSEGRLSSLTASSDYDESIAVGADISGVDVDTRVTNYAIRLNGPRKLTAKARVKNTVYLSHEFEADGEERVGASGFSSELLFGKIKREKQSFAKGEQKELLSDAERIAVPADTIEIITSGGSVRITDATAAEGGVRVTGELILTAIVKTDDPAPFAIKKTVPIDELILIEGVGENAAVSARGVLSDVTVKISEEPDCGAVSFSAACSVSVTVSENEESSLTLDGFLIECASSAEYSDIEYSELVCRDNFNVRFSERIERADYMLSDVRDVILTGAELQSAEIKVEKGMALLVGEIAFCGMACQINEDNTGIYSPVKITLPISEAVNAGVNIPEGASISFAPSVNDYDCILDGDAAELSAAVSLALGVSASGRARILSSLTPAEGTEEALDDSLVTVYYPEADEKLFDVAKRFRKKVSELALDNELSVSASSGDANSEALPKRILIM